MDDEKAGEVVVATASAEEEDNIAADVGNGGSADATQPAAPQVAIDLAKDLWQNIALNVKEGSAEQVEQNVLVVGASGAGKTSLIHRILGSMGKTKPTTALEYSYGKRDDRNTTQIAHFWELAQGDELAQLADVVLTPENVHTVLVMIVLDTTEPGTMWETATFWLKRLDRRVNEIFQRMRAKGSQTPEKLLQRSQKQVGVDHPDLPRLRLCGLPIVLVCNKIDLMYKGVGGVGDTGRIKAMARTMRYLAHLYGTHLAFTSDGNAEKTKYRALLNHLIFQLPFDPKYLQVDPERGGVLLTRDRDSFADIGDPAAANLGEFRGTGDAELDRWKAPFDNMFPPKKSENKLVDDRFLRKLYDASADGFGEQAIDAIRRQKDEELEQYRKNSSRREKKDKKASDE